MMLELNLTVPQRVIREKFPGGAREIRSIEHSAGARIRIQNQPQNFGDASAAAGNLESGAGGASAGRGEAAGEETGGDSAATVAVTITGVRSQVDQAKAWLLSSLADGEESLGSYS